MNRTERQQQLLCAVLVMLFFSTVTSTFPPLSKCFAIDKDHYLRDFTKWIGKEFEFTGKGSDFVIRFCQDAQNRSNLGFVDYGRFSPLNVFISGGSDADLVQEYNFGDLRNCEYNGYDEMGRNTEVRIICGRCPGGASCQDGSGCICSVTYEQKCRVSVLLSLNCGARGPRVFPGFTVGFNPRGQEVVSNSIPQWGFYKPFVDYSYLTDQTTLSLYITAMASLSKSVGKPLVNISPKKGLSVSLSGTAVNGETPTTESPTILEISWKCEIVSRLPYIVQITVPIRDYDPVVFYLSKLCGTMFPFLGNYDYLWLENKQQLKGSSSAGWANFGMLSCTAILLATAFCCAGFCYKTRVEHRRGIDALPGLTVLSTCLDKLSGSDQTYTPVAVSPTFSQGGNSWENSTSVSTQVRPRTTNSIYGTV